MIYEVIPLRPFEDATLTAICLPNFSDFCLPPRRAVIVCPGGGYCFLSEREAEPVATAFLAEGFATFVLRYSVGEKAKDGRPLAELALAVKYLRENAEKYNIDPNYIFPLGFSAGAHLVGSLGLLSHHPAVKAAVGEDLSVVRPTAMVLCYPVVTGGEYTHKKSIQRLTGKENPTDAEREAWSLERHVTKDAPEAFIWQTFDDATVPVENSLMLVNAYVKAGVRCEYHLYPQGVHGSALGTEQTVCGKPEYVNPDLVGWVSMAARFLKNYRGKDENV